MRVQRTTTSSIIWITFLSAGLLTLVGCGPTPVSIAPYQIGDAVRIGLDEGTQTVRLTGSEDITLTVGRSTLQGRTFTITRDRSGLSVTSGRSEARGNRAVAISSAPVRYGDVGYHGAIEITQRDGALTVVNVVALETYLRGVVPREMGYLADSDLEAMKAQAFAARTYTLAHLGRRITRGFDLYGDTRDQVYGGADAESDLGSKAVSATESLVITYDSKLIRAYFHSTCGGSTANIEDVWDSPPLPYLKRIYDGEDEVFYCSESPHFRWVEVYSAAEAQSLVEANLSSAVPDVPPHIGALRDVSVATQSLSGRVVRTRIYAGSESFIVPKEKIRLVLRRTSDRSQILRSSYVRIFADRKPSGELSRLVVSGGGNGHGIGMCQWGAIGMARQNHTAEEIIRHYYRGAEILPYESIGVAGKSAPGNSVVRHIAKAGGALR
jgi:stage II sporulation protein D